MHDDKPETTWDGQPVASTGSELDHVLDELVRRFGRGESPDLDEYLTRHPHLSERLRKAFEAWAALRRPAIDNSGIGGADGESPLVGRLGDFRLLREIGRGGMGVVYEAEQLSLRRRVALKALPFAAVLDGHQLQRFKNEAQAAACLEHRHIVDVYAVGCERGVHYYAMKYIEGQTLRQLIRELRIIRHGQAGEQSYPRPEISEVTERFVTGEISSQEVARVSCAWSGPPDDPTMEADSSDDPPSGAPAEPERPASLSGTVGHGAGATRRAWLSNSLSTSDGGKSFFRSIARIGVQAAEALEHAHQMGVVHRDIKPSNMMLDVNGHLWITDFGLATFEANPDLTMSGMILGTLRYMSPEQMRGDRRVLDHRTDVYSLGVSLYELLALEPAFPGKNPQRLLQLIPSSDPPSPRRIREDIPKDLATIVMKAIAKDPADRYGTAQQLADDLKCYLGDRPIRARRPAAGEIVAKWMRRNTTAVGVCILLCAVAAVGFSISTAMISRAHRNTRKVLTTAEENFREAKRQRRRAEDALSELRRQARITREMAYASDITLAAGAWQKGDSVQQTELLARHIPTADQPDLRGFEWSYLWRQSHLQHSQVIHIGEPLYCIRFAPDGKTLAVSGGGGIVRFFDIRSWKQIRSINARQGEVNGIAFHPAGTRFASAGDDGTIRVWDLADNRQILRIQAHEDQAFQVAFCGNGRSLASCGKEPVIRLWDPATGKSSGTLTGHQKAVEAITISSDGRMLGSASSDGTVAIWSLESRTRVATAALPTGRVICCAFSADARLFAAGNTSGRIVVWDVNDAGSLFRRALVDGSGDGIQCVAFDSQRLALVAGDRGGGIRRWTPTAAGAWQGSSPLRWMGHQGRVYAIAHSASGEQLASVGDDGLLKIWSVVERPRRQRLSESGVTNVALAHDHGTLVTARQDGRVAQWALDTGERTPVGLPEDRLWHKVAISRDAEMLAAGSDRAEIVTWSLADARQVWRWKLSDQAAIDAITFSPDGRMLAAQLWPSDDSVHLLDVRNGGHLASIPARQCEALAFSPDSRRLAVGDWSKIAIHDVATGRRLMTLPSRADTILGLAFGPTGESLVSVGSDRRLALWDLGTGRQRFVHIAHPTRVRAFALSHDGRTIATASAESGLKLWSAVTGQLLLESPMENTRYRQAVFSADGRKLVCLSEDGNAWVYDGSSLPTPPAQPD